MVFANLVFVSTLQNTTTTNKKNWLPMYNCTRYCSLPLQPEGGMEPQHMAQPSFPQPRPASACTDKSPFSDLQETGRAKDCLAREPSALPVSALPASGLETHLDPARAKLHALHSGPDLQDPLLTWPSVVSKGLLQSCPETKGEACHSLSWELHVMVQTHLLTP